MPAFDINDPANFLPLVGANQQSVPANPEINYADLLGLNSGPNIEAVAAPIASSASPISPASAPLPPPIPSLAAPLGGVGAGYSVQGYNPAANAAIQAGPGKKLDRDIATERANVEAEFDPIRQQQQQATDAALRAQTYESEVESAKIAATARAKGLISEAQTDFFNKEQTAVVESKAEAAAAMGDYRAALLDYAAAKVNPAQLWESAGMGGQIAMIATAFGHDFLGARGIQTSGLDSINRAIQNNINSQLENMRKKQDVAAGFKQLWDMQRAQSASDAEARQRMNGFYLQALSNEIESQLGSYDSELALAKGQAAKAAIMKEQVKNDLLVKQHIDKSANDRADQKVRTYAAELQASSSRYSADAHLLAAKIAAGAKQQHPQEGLIRDTTNAGKNVAVRRFFPGIPPAKQAEFQEQTSKVLHTSEWMEKLITLQEAIDKTPPTEISAIKKMQSEAQRAAEQVRQLVRNSLLYDNTGKAINEQEMKIQNDMVSKKDWWTNGDNRRTLALYGKFLLDKQNGILGQVSAELQPGDPAYGTTSGTKPVGEAVSTSLDVQSEPGAGRVAESKVTNFQKWAYAPNAGQAFDVDELPEKGPGNKAQVKNEWERFKKENPAIAPQSDTDTVRRQGPDKKLLDAATAVDYENPDRAFIQIVRLSDLAANGDQDAKQALDQLAKGNPHTADMSGILSAYAQWEKTTKGL